MSFIRQVLQGYAEVRAMAYSRKKAIETLNDLSDQISNHLFLVVHYPNHESYKHWLTELRGWNILLNRRHKGLKGRQNYDMKLLLQYLWEEPLGTEEDRKGALRWAVEVKGLPPLTADIKSIGLRKLTELFCDSVLKGHSFLPGA